MILGATPLSAAPLSGGMAVPSAEAPPGTTTPAPRDRVITYAGHGLRLITYAGHGDRLIIHQGS